MLALIVRRLLIAIPTALALSAVLFFSVSGLLGSPAAMLLGQEASADAIAELNAHYGFDRPLYVQYMDWLGSALTGDLGRSFTTRQSVADAIVPAIPVSLELAVWAILIATIGSIVLNSIPIARRPIGACVTGLNLIGITVPNFMLGISLIFVFSVTLGWLPSTGWVPWSEGIGAHFKHLIMPVLTLSAYYFGAFSIVFRAEQKDVYHRLFIQVARTKGLSEWMIAFKHALPNAVLPVITFVGLSMGHLTGGAVVTETVFSMPGIGRLFVSSIAGHDFPVMLSIGMIIVLGVVLMNLLADILYTVANPQIRFD